LCAAAKLARAPESVYNGAGLRGGAWLSLVERLLWEQDVGGSNPLAPTISQAGCGWVRVGSESISMARARIFRPAKTAMQSGARARKWELAYEPATRREPEALMGWTRADDTLNEVRLHFDNEDEAVAFAKRNGLDFTVIQPHESTEKTKSYADNFRYDRVLH
jgi:NADH dehydrogenase ubiquinone Fe-S protein 4